MAKREKGTECLNCGHHLTDENNFCPNCGQVNDTRRLTTWELIGESLSNFFAVDGRIFRTIAGVFWRPGKVAMEFARGKRMRYMNPVRFYFVCSLLLITSIQLDREAAVINAATNDSDIEQIKSYSDWERDSMRLRVIDEYLAKDKPGVWSRFTSMTDLLIIEPQGKQDEVFAQFGLENGFWNEFAFDQAQKASQLARNQEDNFESFNRVLISKLFWILFLFIPVLGLMLKLIYFRRDFYYPEHIFFALYQQGLFFLASFFYNILFENPVIYVLIMVLFAIHLMMAMRNFYSQTWGKTVLKFGLISLLGLISFSIFFILSLIIVFIIM